jgi:hypothetical protein
MNTPTRTSPLFPLADVDLVNIIGGTRHGYVSPVFRAG